VPLFLEDVDAALVAPNAKLTTRVPYTAWAKSYHNFRDSESAKGSISWNADRLSGISKQQNALFPFARVPGMFKGNSDGWIDLSTGKPGPKREMLDEVVSMISRTDVGILWNCSMPARDEVQVHASWDSAQLQKTEMDKLLKELVDLIEQLADRETWLKRVVDLK
jgi:hypothetical protein